MPKQFYSERDIEELASRGILSLEINDQVVLTDLAYEKANRLGLRLLREKMDTPASGPVRPYLSANPTRPEPTPSEKPVGQAVQAARLPMKSDRSELDQRIRSSVIARLGTQIDPILLDVIISRVFQATGIK